MRLGHANETWIGRFQLLRNENRAGFRLRELRHIKLIPEEAELILGRIFERGDAADDPVGRPFVTAADERNDFFDGNRRHGGGL